MNKTFLHFEKRVRPKDRKTDVFEVWTGGKPYDDDGERFAELGEINWYAPWRRYVFLPNANTLFDAGCLREIVAFLDRLMAARRTGTNA